MRYYKTKIEREVEGDFQEIPVTIGYLFSRGHKSPSEYGHPMWPDEGATVEIEECLDNEKKSVELTDYEKEYIEIYLCKYHMEGGEF